MSKYLSPKLVVAEAWDITREHKKELFWYGFVPEFFGMIVATVYIMYQVVAFRHFFLQEEDTVKYGEIFQKFWDFISAEGTPTVSLVIIAIVVLIAYFVLPVFCKSSLIFLIEKIQKGEDLEKGIQVGFMRFIPMFEFGAVKNAASIKAFLTESSFVVRNLGPGMFQLLLPVMIVLTFFGLVAQFFFAYTPQAIVLNKTGLMASIAKSSRLSFDYFTETLRLFILILLIELRVFLNIAIILFLPVAVFAITGLFATTVLKGVGIFLAGIVALLLISGAAFISGTLEIFSTAIWTIAFHKLTPNEEKITEL